MSENGRCPYCGSVPGWAGTDATRAPARPDEAGLGLGPLYHEMRRIREIAEAHAPDEDARRIAELTRQVQDLRATVARLRGSGVGVPAAGAVVSSRSAS